MFAGESEFYIFFLWRHLGLMKSNLIIEAGPNGPASAIPPVPI